jgi:chromate transport protein ChrA
MIRQSPSLRVLFWTFLKIGSTAFGGLMSLIAVVENVIVERMQLLPREDILDGISLATCLPGAISVNVIAYTGYRMRGAWGTFVSLVGVILPSFLLILGLAIAYFHWGQIPTLDKVFAGFVPAVAAIIFSTAWHMGRTVIKSWREATIAILAALLPIAIGGAYTTILIILCSGAIGCLIFNQNFTPQPPPFWGKSEARNPSPNKQRNHLLSSFTFLFKSMAVSFLRSNKLSKILCLISLDPYAGGLGATSRPQWGVWGADPPKSGFSQGNLKSKHITLKRYYILFLLIFAFLAYLAPSSILENYPLPNLFVTFAGISVMLFGGAYVGIPLIQEIVVSHHHWLTPQEFAYGIALGQITPGPIIISAAFIGYKVSGILGALVASFGIFSPPTLLIIMGARILGQIRESSYVKAALQGIRPAVLGTIFAAAWVVGKTAPLHWLSGLIFLAAFVALVPLRVNVAWIIPIAGLIGLFFAQ